MSFRDFKVNQKASGLAMEIFEVSKCFPKEERYPLTDQTRRSSRSVCVNFAEGYRKRRYEKHFLAKVSDSGMENAETQSWLEFALACKYIDQETFDKLQSESVEVGKLLGFMIRNPKRFT